MTLQQLKIILIEEASDRKTKAVNLFLSARRGEQIDGKELVELDNEAKKIDKAIEELD